MANKTTKTETTTTSINPFETLGAVVKSDASTRKLPWTNELTATATARATALMTEQMTTDDRKAKAKQLLMGNPMDCYDLLTEVFGDQLTSDAAFLADADEDSLKRMLESQRSVRSVAKKKGLTTAVNVRAYIAAMYAEMLLRERMGRPFTGSNAGGAEVNTEDLEAVTKKVKSLQSKKCRLNKLYQAGDASVKDELDATIAEIERLNAFKPTSRQTTSVKTAVKSMKVDELRAMLGAIDKEQLPADQVAAYEALMAKLG